MYLSSIENFKEDIERIRAYLKYIEYVNTILSNIPSGTNLSETQSLSLSQPARPIFNTDKKIFEYNAIIISLYGIIERYVERFVKEYLELLSQVVPNYNELDDKLKDKHFELSIKLITIISNRDSAKYQHITKEIVLKQLNSCVENTTDYKINADAFVLLSSGNLKHNKITELLLQINISLNNELQRNEKFVAFLKEAGYGEQLALVNPETLYFKLNDLVERRNEIAHGADRTDNILNINELQTYIDFSEQYIHAIFEILREMFIKNESEHLFRKIENVKGIAGDTILGFEIEDSTIQVGDKLIIQTAENRFLEKTILDIHLNGVSHKILNIKNKTVVSIKVSPKIKKNQMFFIQK